MENNIILKKFGSVDNSIICFLNNDTDNLRLHFAEVYNNGYNTNNFNVYENGSMGFDNSVSNTKFDYLTKNIDFFVLLERLTEIYSKIIMNYKKANYYILKNKKDTNDFILIMNKISDYKYQLSELDLQYSALHHTKKEKFNTLKNQLIAITEDVKFNKYIYGYWYL